MSKTHLELCGDLEIVCLNAQDCLMYLEAVSSTRDCEIRELLAVVETTITLAA